ncbi:piRNA biogenesis protein EXD1 isoform X1 [Rhinatrema bivittatum]|uniref:piRNA biogenesis protein EXD1 isoform X1 n=1 Tax=Rhinatrema bivittatum TaxID=194408 RepID=UPI00112C263E|nr:piRNA biogenesis protein EXD1 isoform X1 [Rhinatrema bivittatum]XP_029454464.1 piRNA biogenesis protein EXD1 isoform X1 [Rhinatrema bivittatum]XP_029454465.1 piRNA biogenesis protein EXD1 isoform X1 [Rhinatrema bivittatum]XP_029454466.1 piRNA biogenesis protein EXD1 isoform X1 [Rhinatrema bivittatum]
MEPKIDRSFLNRILGKKMKITLTYGSFQGILLQVDPSRTILLSEVKDLETNRSLPGVKLFFGRDIVNVELINETEQDALEDTTPAPISKEQFGETVAMDGSQMAGCAVEGPAFNSQKIWTCPTSAFKQELAGTEDVEYVVIDGFQHKFGPVIRHIKSQNVISVAAEGLNLCRNGKLFWLQVATQRQVYLFDISVLGARAFRNGLQTVLEDKSILKVIHDCRWLSDCLSHQYGIVLSNVFDTQIADVFLFSVGTGGFLPHCISTLEESLIRYLGLSSGKVSFLKHKQRVLQADPNVWLLRPTPPSLLKVLALEVVYLLPLRLVLMDELMSDFVSLVDGYLDAYRQNPPGLLGSIEFSSMELPDELCHLTALQEMRREKAVKEFKMNERGLLVRSQNSEQEETEDTNDMHTINLQSPIWPSSSQHFKGEGATPKSLALQEKLFLEDGLWLSKRCKDMEASSSGEVQVQTHHAQAGFSLQAQMETMQIKDKEEGKKQSTTYAGIPLIVSSNYGGPFQVLKKPLSPTLPSSSGLQAEGDKPSFRPLRTEAPAVRFAQLLQFGIRMPAPV